ncbi:NAD(P)-binding protein [Martensiomyces pterosporus]|nr:NAD(P)-binding protein [Martensiomyces pterosporus]
MQAAESEEKTRERLADKPQFSVRGIDYDDDDDLISALTGQDAVLSTIGGEALLTQIKLVKAAEKAGVKYFVPSEFGSDINEAQNKEVTLFDPKRAVQAALKESSVSYIFVNNGFFSDYTIGPFLWWDVPNKSINIVGDGSAKNSFTSRADVAKYTIAVLKRAEEFKNQDVRFAGDTLSFNEWVALAEQESGSKFTVTNTPAAEVRATVAKDKETTGGWTTIFEQLLLVLEAGSGKVNWGDNQLDNDKFPEIKPTPTVEHVKQALRQY